MNQEEILELATQVHDLELNVSRRSQQVIGALKTQGANFGPENKKAVSQLLQSLDGLRVVINSYGALIESALQESEGAHSKPQAPAHPAPVDPASYAM